MLKNNVKLVAEDESADQTRPGDWRRLVDMLIARKYDEAGAVAVELGEPNTSLWRVLQGNTKQSMMILSTVQAKLAEILTLSAWANGNAQRLSHESSTVSSGTEELAQSLHKVASSSETARAQAAEVKTLVSSSISRAQTAEQAMSEISGSFEQLNDRLQSLDGAIETIGGFAKDIEAISNQTKLLALNATIEAARAGEAGKGFAVVASEVKSLSEQTSRTTELIGKQLADLDNVMTAMIESMTEGGSKVREGAESFSLVATEISTMRECIDVADAEINSISDMLISQTENLDDVAKSVGEIADVAKNNFDDSKSSIDLLNQMERLVTGKLDEFLDAQIPYQHVARLRGTHLSWKRRLADCLVGLSDPASLNPADLAKPFGLWMEGIDDASMRQSPAYKALSSAEAQLREAGEAIAEQMRCGDHGGAIGAFFGMEEASQQALGHIDSLEEQVAQG